MGFEKFGRKSFTAVTKTAKFVDLLAEGKVEGTACKGVMRDSSITSFCPKMTRPTASRTVPIWAASPSIAATSCGWGGAKTSVISMASLPFTFLSGGRRGIPPGPHGAPQWRRVSG